MELANNDGIINDERCRNSLSMFKFVLSTLNLSVIGRFLMPLEGFGT